MQPDQTAGTTTATGEKTADDVRKNDVMDVDAAGLTAVRSTPPSTNSTQSRSNGPHGGERDELEVEKDVMRSRMFAGTWRVHHSFGVPICESALRALQKQKLDGKPCTSCKAYLAHLSDGLLANDDSLLAANRIRDIDCTRHLRTKDASHASGKLSVTERALTDANERIEDLCIDLLKTSERAAGAEREADQLHAQLKRARDEIAESRQRVQELERRQRDLNSHLDHVDEGRARKRTSNLPQSSSSADSTLTGPNIVRTQTNYPPRNPVTPSSDDVPMTDATRNPSNARIDWSNIDGIPAMILRYHTEGSHTRQPVPNNWNVTGTGEPADIAAWDLARDYALANKSFAVELSVFRVYVEARQVEPEALTKLQAHAIEKYRIYAWFLSILKGCFIKRSAVRRNNKFWADSVKVRYGEPVPVIAATYQRTGYSPPGCPFVDSYRTLNSRLVRGSILWSTINVASIRGRAPTATERVEGVAVATALLLILAVPHGYQEYLASYCIAVNSVENLQCWPRDKTDPEDLSIQAVLTRLAAIGLSITAVDDAYDFFQSLALDIITNQRQEWDIEIIRTLVQSNTDAVEANGKPAGLSEEYGEFLVRPPGLPWTCKELNAVQESGLFLENLPLVPLPGSTATRYITILDEEGTPTAYTRQETDRYRDRESMNRDGNRGGRGGIIRRGGRIDAGARIRQYAPTSTMAPMSADTASAARTATAARYPQPPSAYSPLSQSAAPNSTSTFAMVAPQSMMPSYWNGLPYPIPAGFASNPAAHAVQQQNHTAMLFGQHPGVHHAPSSLNANSSASSSSSTSNSHEFVATPDALNVPFTGMNLDYSAFTTT
ncbi:hypothetical protein B0H12DRAFT_1077822 [Mycena haematopus]|nr:hypothetical protein B0H12DRAFT_1077822 [Mycena haematopus]